MGLGPILIFFPQFSSRSGRAKFVMIGIGVSGIALEDLVSILKRLITHFSSERSFMPNFVNKVTITQCS